MAAELDHMRITTINNYILYALWPFYAVETHLLLGTIAGCTPRIDNIKTWTGLPVEEPITMTDDMARDKWRKYAHGVANPRTEDG